MNVLFDGRCLVQTHLGGVQQYVRALRDEFARQGRPVTFATPPGPGRLAHHVWEHVTLPRLARRHDVLFCPGNVAPVHVARPTRLVATIHCLRFLNRPQAYQWAFRRYYEFLIPRVIRRADAVITVSQTQADELAERFPHVEDRLHVVPLGVGAEFHPAAEPKKEPAILFVGDLGAGKNLRLLLQAFAQLAGDVPHELWIVGQAPPIVRTDALAAAESADLPVGRVRWLGQVARRDVLADLYRRAELLVFPSVYESFGLPAAEAMACGTAVLAGDVPALRETIGEAGVFADPHDVDALASGMRTVLLDADLRAELERRGPIRARPFSWHRCAEATWEVLCDVAD